MKNKKWITGVIALLTLVFMLSGCGQNAADSPKAPDSPVAAEKTVVDMADRTVILPAEIKTIATFGSIGVINSFVELFGEGNKIINQMSPSFTKTD